VQFGKIAVGVGIGADNLLHTDRTKLRLRFSIINLTNKDVF